MDFDWTFVKMVTPGAIGAGFAVLAGPKRRKTGERVLEFLSGCAFAVYGTTPLLHYCKLDPAVYHDIVCFSLGFAGLRFASKVLEVILEKFK